MGARSRDGHKTAKEQQCCRNDTACTCGWPARERLLVRIGVCVYALRAKMESSAHATCGKRLTVSCLIADAAETTSSKFTTPRAITRRNPDGLPPDAWRRTLATIAASKAVRVLKDVVAQFDRQRPARLSVAILNARRADRFPRRATQWLSHEELVLLLRGAFVQMKRENHGSKHRTLWETLSTALRKLAGRECLPCRAYELV